jgi:AcrR family transcriptional regulator
VAHAALTESPDASLNSIAKRAGVAHATLYRHFPTREAVVLEVYWHEVRQLAALADDLIASQMRVRRWSSGWTDWPSTR